MPALLYFRLERLNLTVPVMRLHAQTAMIENGFVDLPESAPWLAEYLHEMTVFPNGKHDNQVDSTAQFLDCS
jgi:predicted phage terminase large subunit-like protein